MGAKRRLLVAVVALGLAPGTFVRSEIPPKDYTSPVSVRALDVGALDAGPLVLEGAWELASPNDHFGGYSALVARGNGVFLAASDAGRLMHLPRPDRSKEAPQVGEFMNLENVDKRNVDIESLTVDPATGRIWAGLEWSQSIRRFGPDLAQQASVAPFEMAGWEGNAGPESLVRLQDGRFIAVEEYALADGLHEAFLFPADPATGVRPLRFVLQAREDYRPADAALLPDGRIAFLLRKLRWRWPLEFPGMIVIADPREIRRDHVLPTRLLARIDEPLPSDNYEGLAVTVEEDGDWALWLISDDNFSRYQRTLLLKLVWPQQRQKARR